MRLNAKQIAAYTGGEFLVEPIDASALMTGITWDSREVQEGWLFVALIGERVDGHRFVAQALRAGAWGALVMESPDAATLLLAREMGAAIIEVPNTESAITDLAREWRGHLQGKIIGLTGSAGKTTTKNLVRDVLSAGFSVVATIANQNNELGVPNTLLQANPETQAVVVEMGMRGLGQIAQLCDLAHPDWGLITNIGDCHLELLGSKASIAQAKGELFEAVPSGTGRAFLNLADEFAMQLCRQGDLQERSVACVGYDGSGSYDESTDSFPPGPRVWARDITLDDEGHPTFHLHARGFRKDASATEDIRCTVGLRGIHNVSNACAAAAVGLSMGLSLPTVAEALAKSLPESGRQEVLQAPGGYTVVNDAYNANPDSMRASLAMFCALNVPGQRYAVLGDMAELGEFAEACHRGVGHSAAALPLDELICVGGLSELIAQGAVEAGMEPEKVQCLASVAEVLEELEDRLEPGDAVLVKASHCMGLDHVAEGLVR